MEVIEMSDNLDGIMDKVQEEGNKIRDEVLHQRYYTALAKLKVIREQIPDFPADPYYAEIAGYLAGEIDTNTPGSGHWYANKMLQLYVLSQISPEFRTTIENAKLLQTD
jgi:hypothetical protein